MIQRSSHHRDPAGRWPATVSGAFMALAAAWVLFGCGSGSGDDTVTVQGDVPLAYVKRANTLSLNPTNGAPTAPGGDLLIREKSSPSAPEHNVTESITLGNGDASDPEVSYDGKKIVFALRCPASNESTVDGQPACTGRWNIWEYDMTEGGFAGGKLRRLTDSTQNDDVDPAYLPAGAGVVFASNRQAKSFNNQALGRDYYALDEYERERVFHLHTMAADGSNIQQITFNQSHDRNPVVRANGDIMFSRWEHAADHNRFAIFRVKPDGTDLFVLYGALSPGNSFLHPREMDPDGPYKGFLASSLMPLQQTQEGGALMFIDAANYSEANTPANSTVPTEGGQRQITERELNLDRGLSLYGRVTTPYPLWDGTDRVLLSYRPCEVMRGTDIVACATLSAAERERLADRERPLAEAEADELQDNVPASYAVYMFDPKIQAWSIVAAPPAGFMLTDPVALQARSEPNAAQPTELDEARKTRGVGKIAVRSVYDTDGLGRMGEGMLAPSDRAAGCTQGIATTTPAASQEETRTTVADLARMKNPADAAYRCAPAYFVRALRGVPPPSNSMGVRTAIGETDFEQQQILGYAPVEPDGSFQLEVPADVPLALQVVDSQGRAFQQHPNWIQVRPGETRTCDGCHSPRRGAALNSGATVNLVPDAWLASWRDAKSGAYVNSGETMAALRTRINPPDLQVGPHLVSSDIWTDASKATPRPTIAITYDGLPSGERPVNGIINYPEHIQPLWTRARPGGSCVSCHNGTIKLNLNGTTGGSGRMASYDALLIGDPRLDANGQPLTRLVDGVPEVEREVAVVNNMSGAMNAAGIARKSRLMEILSGEQLLAGAAARAVHPTPAGVNHATLLNASEKRVLAEWMDLGAQYYNDPFNSGSGVRTVASLSESTFASQVMPVLRTSCVSCHQPVGSNGTSTTVRNNRFVITGDAEGDYNAVLAVINDTCNAAANPLLARPSTAPHPQAGTAAVLPAGSAAYNTIATWISSGCTTR
jgi:hypothetical protein